MLVAVLQKDFCDDGIKSFCSEFGFNVKQSYTPNEIYSRVKTDLSRAMPYLAELKTLANAVNFQAPELNNTPYGSH